ncbi:MAG: hypothetical protein KJO06_11510 [Gemmatimonadetes bacterium]|nr:hypothetical protein [Gemmatimonadota bacterium]
MIVARRQKRSWWLTCVAAGVVWVSGAAVPAEAQETVAIDRWLVSSPFPVDSDEDPLGIDYLGAPGEVAVLPDRGRTVAGADWKLVRRDSAAVLDLEAFREGADGPVVVYAHAYLKSLQDRTVELTWGGLECTSVEAWLNGRALAAVGRASPGSAAGVDPANRQARVRVGRGYNTLLMKAVSGDCSFGVTASVGPASATSLDGFRVQASRPYGNTRTGPAPWLIADPEAGPEPILGWKEDRLFGAGGVRVTAFAVTAIEGARFKAKTGGDEVRRRIEWLTPAEPKTVLMPLSFESLRRAVDRGEGMAVELDWDGGKWKGVLSLDPEALLTAFRSSIRLLGWTVVKGSAGPAVAGGAAIYDSEEEPHPLANLIQLPASAGTTLLGEWEVPGWLSGFTLALDIEGAPGEYRLDSVPVQGERVVLCADCRKGDRIQVVVITEGAWERFPGASIVDLPEVTVDSADQAAEWLKLIDQKGSRKFRERASATGQ